MYNPKKVIRKEVVPTPGEILVIQIEEEDFSGVYPGMVRYTVSALAGDRPITVFKTNTYEYAPLVPLEALEVASRVADEWKALIREDPDGFRATAPSVQVETGIVSRAAVVIIQGSPRADGNCGIMAGWVAEEARTRDLPVAIIFPDELAVHPCIGCYQCYNTGFCTFSDDMGEVINALSRCSLLVVCSPVYTNTVPGGLKILIDRCLAYHARRTIGGEEGQQGKGILLSVAGRRGQKNFTCITHVVEAFFQNLGFTSSGRVLADGTDDHDDVRTMPGIREQVRDLAGRCLGSRGPT
jgi:multimeric flavodoxin WrbA